ncbi:hypothetical protein [Sulfurihydrogenibium sp.]|uniref:hypothetical protein n=1 Tax=Sulfurihydrogenibium sp. TaxID=2053621 RepID=UPI0026193C09|nr:hypothetical protein [Sulfurihydrogenibium sp.]
MIDKIKENIKRFNSLSLEEKILKVVFLILLTILALIIIAPSNHQSQVILAITLFITLISNLNNFKTNQDK